MSRMVVRSLVLAFALSSLPARAAVVINEFMPDANGTDTGYEWVELYNSGVAPVELDGWSIERATSGFGNRYTFGPYTLNPGEFVVVGGEFVAFADLNLAPAASLGMGNASTSGDAVRILDGTAAVIDTVIYGPNNNDAFLDDDGLVAVSIAAMSGADESIARTLDGVDTNDSGLDFTILPVPTPGSPNGAPPPVDTSQDTGPPPDTGPLPDTGPDTGPDTSGTDTAGDTAVPPAPVTASIVVNEFLPDAVGADGGNEWIEIKNIDVMPVDLVGWQIERGTTPSFGLRYTFGSYVLSPGEVVVVGGEFVLFADVNLAPGDTLNFGNASSSGDAVRLVDGIGGVADTVIYGPDNSDGFLDDDGLIASSIATDPGEGESLSRVPDGVDTNDSGVDFDVTVAPSPGADNPSPAIDTGNDTAHDTGDTGDTAPTPPLETGVIVINEFLANVGGSDDGLEWIELRNNDVVSVNLRDWVIEDATSSFSAEYTFPDYDLAPGDYVVVGGEFIGFADLNLQAGDYFSFPNASSSGDGIRILDGFGAVIDTVIYGPDNSDGLLDDDGLVAVSVAAMSGEDESLARMPDGSDTNDSGVDFSILLVPTPGAMNEIIIDTGGGGDTGDTAVVVDPPSTFAGDVVVNEFIINPAGADDGLEWIEIVNVSGSAMDIDGWSIQAGTSSFSTKYTFTTVVLNAGDRLVVGGEFVAGADINLDFSVLGETFSFGNASSNADGVRLVDATNAAVDTVIYGPNNDDGFRDDDGAIAAPAPKPGEEEVLARVPDGSDTNDSSVDFWVLTDPTLGEVNIDPRDACDQALQADGLVINEFKVKPGGEEWLELYNGGTASVDISQWRVAYGPSSFSNTETLPDGISLAPGAFLLLGEGGDPAVADFFVETGMSDGTSNTDGVRLEDCVGDAVDTVIYSDPAIDEEITWIDDTGAIASSFAPKPDTDASLSRRFDGLDTDQSGSDFQSTEIMTPGAPNAQPIDCTPSTGGVVLNEFVSNPDGTDDGLEWVELYNATDADVVLDGWMLAAASNIPYEDQVDVSLPAGTVIGAGDWYVIGGDLVEEADHKIGPDDFIGNASSSNDAIVLFDCDMNQVDTVVYGDEDENVELLTDDNGEEAVPSPTPASAESLARVEDGVDTNKPEDWKLVGAPTPGATNFSEPSTSSGESKGCGCNNRDAPGGSAPDADNDDASARSAPGQGGCTTVPLPFGGLEWLVMLIVLRRRDEK